MIGTRASLFEMKETLKEKTPININAKINSVKSKNNFLS